MAVKNYHDKKLTRPKSIYKGEFKMGNMVVELFIGNILVIGTMKEDLVKIIILMM